MTNSRHPEIALWYASQGWHVHPLAPGTKFPPKNCPRCTKPSREAPNPRYIEHHGTAEDCRCIQAGKWCHGVRAATADPSRIEQWWRQGPDFGVAIATGLSGLLVIDLDDHGDPPPSRDRLLPGVDLPAPVQPRPDWTGTASLRLLAELRGRPDPLTDPPTLVVTTPSGNGTHAWFTVPDAMAWKPAASKLGWQVDVRAAWSFAVAPGVTVKGGTYRVTSECMAPAPLPAWLAAELERTGHRRAEHTRPPRPEGWRPPAPTGGRRYVVRAATSELATLAAAPKGTRNDQAYRSAFAMGQLVGAGFLDEQEIREGLVAAADHAGLDGREAEAAVERGLADGARNPRQIRKGAA